MAGIGRQRQPIAPGSTAANHHAPLGAAASAHSRRRQERVRNFADQHACGGEGGWVWRLYRGQHCRRWQHALHLYQLRVPVLRCRRRGRSAAMRHRSRDTPSSSQWGGRSGKQPGGPRHELRPLHKRPQSDCGHADLRKAQAPSGDVECCAQRAHVVQINVQIAEVRQLNAVLAALGRHRTWRAATVHAVLGSPLRGTRHHAMTDDEGKKPIVRAEQARELPQDQAKAPAINLRNKGQLLAVCLDRVAQANSSATARRRCCRPSANRDSRPISRSWSTRVLCEGVPHVQCNHQIRSDETGGRTARWRRHVSEERTMVAASADWRTHDSRLVQAAAAHPTMSRVLRSEVIAAAERADENNAQLKKRGRGSQRRGKKSVTTNRRVAHGRTGKMSRSQRRRGQRSTTQACRRYLCCGGRCKHGRGARKVYAPEKRCIVNGARAAIAHSWKAHGKYVHMRHPTGHGAKGWLWQCLAERSQQSGVVVVSVRSLYDLTSYSEPGPG